MKRLLTAAVTCAWLFAATLATAAADVSGTWELEMTWNGGEATSTGICTFAQNGDRLSGTCGGGSDRFPLTGTITGNRMVWGFDVKQDSTQGRMEFTGLLDERGAAIRGSCRIVGIQDGTFTMTKRREAAAARPSNPRPN